MIAPERIRRLNSATPPPGARYVIYWALANRRVDSNHGVAFAAELANQYGIPLLFYEGLTCTYPFASDRLHSFILEGVPDNACRARELGMGYIFHLHRRTSDPHNALYKLAARAAAIVTDDYPSFVPASYNGRVPAKIGVPNYTVDSMCIVPMQHFRKQEYAAYTIRPKIRTVVERYLEPPKAPRLRYRWEQPGSNLHTEVIPEYISELVRACEIDHSVPPPQRFRGGRKEAKRSSSIFCVTICAVMRSNRASRRRTPPRA